MALAEVIEGAWDRGPNPQLAREIERLKQRRRAIFGQAHRLLTSRCRRGRLFNRWFKLAQLYAEVNDITISLGELELN